MPVEDGNQVDTRTAGEVEAVPFETIDNLWEEAKADRAAGRPSVGTRGAADIPAEDR